MSRLHVVSTPIGNLGDMTLRALDVLRAADLVLAEDTRRTRVLLDHFEIGAKVVALHAHNEAARAKRVLEWLDEGLELALVSDAGTPLLSDPGARLVARVLEGGHEVVPVPGASAILAALVGAGLAPEPFTFLGFLPRSGTARDTALERIATLDHTSVVFESPNRLAATLADLAERCGAERRATVARELTKLHETFVRGTLGELAAYYEDGAVRGEVVVVVAGAEPAGPDEDAAVALASALLERGERPSAVAREIAKRLDISRNEAYELVQRLTSDRGE